MEGDQEEEMEIETSKSGEVAEAEMEAGGSEEMEYQASVPGGAEVSPLWALGLHLGRWPPGSRGTRAAVPGFS